MSVDYGVNMGDALTHVIRRVEAYWRPSEQPCMKTDRIHTDFIFL
jgi:hypothetical protein